MFITWEQSPNSLPLSLFTPLRGPLCQCAQTGWRRASPNTSRSGQLVASWSALFWSWKTSLTWHSCVPIPHQVWRGQEEKTQASPGWWQFSSRDKVCPKKNSRTIQDRSSSGIGTGGGGGLAGSLLLPQPQLSPSQEGAELTPRPHVLGKHGRASPWIPTLTELALRFLHRPLPPAQWPFELLSHVTPKPARFLLALWEASLVLMF